MTWELYSFGFGDFLRIIFNGLASIFGSGDYGSAIATSAMMGFVGVLVAAAFGKGGMENFRWMLTTIFFYMVVVVPKVDVQIIDEVNPANSAVVSKVPLGVAAPASFFSQAGVYFATAFETVFSLPGSLNYTESGLAMHRKVFDSFSDMEVSDTRTSKNLDNLFGNCLYKPAAIGHFELADAFQTGDIRTWAEGNFPNSSFGIMYRDSSGSDSYMGCQDAAEQVFDDIEAIEDDIIRNALDSRVNFNFTQAEVKADFESNASGAFNELAGVSRTTGMHVMQSSLANAISRSPETAATKYNNDAFIQSYTIEKAEKERKTTYQSMGEIASRNLPKLRALFEAFLYMVSPIIILMAIIVPTKVSIGYIKALVWVNLWTPMYSILNFAMVYFDKGRLTAVAANNDGFSAVALAEMTPILADTAATAGYLSISIPMIAWMLVSNAGALMAGVGNRMTSSHEGSVSGTAQETSAGNFNFASMNAANASAGTIDTQPRSIGGSATMTEVNQSGTQRTSFESGRETFTTPTASGVFDGSLREQRTESERAAFQEKTESALSEARSVLTEAVESNDTTTMEGLRDAFGISDDVKNGQELVDAFDNKAAATYNDIESAQVGANANARWDSSSQMLGWVAEKLSGASVNAGVSAGVSASTNEMSQEQYSTSTSGRDTEAATESTTSSTTGTMEDTSANRTSESDRALESLANDFREASSAAESYESAYAFSAAGNVNVTDMARQELVDNGDMSADEFAELQDKSQGFGGVSSEEMKEAQGQLLDAAEQRFSSGGTAVENNVSEVAGQNAARVEQQQGINRSEVDADADRVEQRVESTNAGRQGRVEQSTDEVFDQVENTVNDASGTLGSNVEERMDATDEQVARGAEFSVTRTAGDAAEAVNAAVNRGTMEQDDGPTRYSSSEEVAENKLEAAQELQDYENMQNRLASLEGRANSDE